MTSSRLPDDLVFVRTDQREPGSVMHGQVREKAYAASGILVGYCDITVRDHLASGTTMPTTTASCI